MPALINPQDEILQRVAQINQGTSMSMMDDQETADRQEAAQAYAGENEQHFVRYMEDMVKTSVDSMTEIRANQQECWDVYNEKEPPNYAMKETWQNRVVVPKPYSSCQFASAIVRKAFDVEFLSVENEQDNEAAVFWEKLMGLQLSRNYANFPIRITDATAMSFAVGQSMEMISQWIPGKGLRYVLTEPWKIHRDPDAISRECQSGMYWIHQEWLDFYTLKEGEKDGRFRNIEAFSPGATSGNTGSNVNLSREEIARRKEMWWARSTFRSMILTSEFWGTVLAPNGELLLPNAAYTVAGGRVISLPKASPYPSLRWPGVGYSILPHLLRFDGRGLIQGIKSLWYFMNSLFCLHADNLNWLVNPPTEIDVSSLVDQSDVDNYPGKQYLTRGTVSGQQAIRPVERRSNTGDILANMNFGDQRFQEGVMFNYASMGLPGYRAEVTARESAQNLDQSMTVTGLMGMNLEDGALQAILAGAETVAINITYDELKMLMGETEKGSGQFWADLYRDPDSPTGLTLPKLTTGSFHVSGISALMRDQEIIKNIATLLLPMFNPATGGEVFAPYLKPYALLQSIEKRLNLRDERIIVSEEDAKRIDAAQQQQQEAGIQGKQQQDQIAMMGLQAKAERDAAEAESARAEVGKHAAQADSLGAKSELDMAKAELARAQAQVQVAKESEARSPEIDAAEADLLGAKAWVEEIKGRGEADLLRVKAEGEAAMFRAKSWTEMQKGRESEEKAALVAKTPPPPKEKPKHLQPQPKPQPKPGGKE